jgi:hypothetical protein
MDGNRLPVGVVVTKVLDEEEEDYGCKGETRRRPNVSSKKRRGSAEGLSGPLKTEPVTTKRERDVSSKKRRGSASGPLTTEPGANFVQNTSTAGPAERKNSWLTLSSSPIQSDPSDPFIPFVRVPLDTRGSLFLGNDTIRAALSKAEPNSIASSLLRRVVPEVTNEAAALVESFGLEFHMPMENRQPTTLENCTLLVSVNDLQQSGTMRHVEVKGLEYIYAPINENRVDLYPKIFAALYNQGPQEDVPEVFASLFERMDAVLTSGKDVFIHCNQGEHRSAAVTVLYVCWRAQQTGFPCDFERAHGHVLQYRSVIKPCTDRRATLMTEFARLHKEHGQ